MKKTAIVFFAICFLAIAGCGSNNGVSSNPNESSPSISAETITPGASENVSSETAWDVQEVEAAFMRMNFNANCSVIDCVAVTDFAFELVGVVLFEDVDNQTINAAFIDKDGSYQQCGLYAKIHSNSELMYCGNGVVTFNLEAEDGTPNSCKVSFSKENSIVCFIVDDDL